MVLGQQLSVGDCRDSGRDPGSDFLAAAACRGAVDDRTRVGPGPCGHDTGDPGRSAGHLAHAARAAASLRLKVLVIVVAVGGVITYRQVCKVGGVTVFHADPRSALPSVDVAGGLGYALSVPGRLLWPSLMGIPVTSNDRPVAGMVLLRGRGPGARRHRGTRPLAPGLVEPAARVRRGRDDLLSYALTYSARTVMLKEGRWTEPQFLYQFAARYHVLPLLGLVTIIAAVLASWPLVRRCDARRGLPALLAALVGLVTMLVQSGEASHWNWMLRQPDQQRHPVGPSPSRRIGKRRGRYPLAVDANLRPGLSELERIGHERPAVRVPPHEPGRSSP